MKRFLLLLATIGVIATACQTDGTSDNEVGIGEEGTVLTVSIEPTRTSLGDKVGDTYPYYWSEGDKIVVNGKLSDEVAINADNKASATFKFSKATLSYPYYITYPYCTSTTAENPIVEFPAEQSYAEGTFSTNSAPMCGYVDKKGDKIKLNHLAGILRFPLKASYDGVVLEKVVITSTNSIAGEFAVNCQTTAISATESCGNVITYSLPDNFILSTTTPSDLFISLPAVEVGACTIEFVETSGEKMVANWSMSKPLSKGVVREFKTITYQPKATISLQPLTSEDDEFTIFYKNIRGHVRYSDDDSPIANVAVSDGFQVVKTDANGYYELNGVTRDTWYIYCSLPADVKVPIDDLGRPCFFKKYEANVKNYDFEFEKLPNGPEEEFAIFGLADIQVSNSDQVARFNAQAAPEIKSYSATLGIPCYGVALGDIIYSTPNHNDEYLLGEMRDALKPQNVGMPVFAVYGNHDNAYYCETKPIFPDDRNSDFNIKIQRPFEDTFGPVNYSFNRGDAHFVCMRNMQYRSNISPWDPYEYDYAITDKQYEWVKQDLAVVPKDKMVVLCVHIPIFNRTSQNFQEVLDLIDVFADAHILSGHTHYQRPYDHVKLNRRRHIYEHCMAAIFGAGWTCNLSIDGSPNGYMVLSANGNTFNGWYYKGYPFGMNDKNYQIRMYRGNEITGAAIPNGDANKNGTKGYYQFGYSENTILANIFSSDPNWSVEVWEDGSKTGNMTSIYQHNSAPAYTDLVGSYVLNDPKRPAVASARDFYTAGVMLGYLGAAVTKGYGVCWTMWKYELTNPNAKHIEVRANDKFGNVYTCDEFQVGTDMTYAIYNAANNPK